MVKLLCIWFYLFVLLHFNCLKVFNLIYNCRIIISNNVITAVRGIAIKVPYGEGISGRYIEIKIAKGACPMYNVNDCLPIKDANVFDFGVMANNVIIMIIAEM